MGGKLQNKGPVGTMTIEKIQDLILNATKVWLGGDVRKMLLYTKPYTQRVNTSAYAPQLPTSKIPVV